MLFDEKVIANLDLDEEVQKVGRSAVLRRLVAAYLEHRREAAIDAQYARGYAAEQGLGPEFEGWEDEGTWPTE